MDTKYTATIKELPDAMIEITGEISWDAFQAFEKKAFERLAKHLELPGFRKGHVPEDVAKKQLGDELVLTDMAELAIQEFYPIIVQDKNLDVIGRPQLAITKLARGNALGFIINTAVLPEIKLPNYKKIAKGIEKETIAEATGEEIEKVIKDLQQIRAYGHVHPEGDAHEHKHEEPLPEVNDEFAKSFGDFANVGELRTKIKENMTREKEQDIKDKRRVKIMEKVIEETKFEVPKIILQAEQEKMLAQIEADISRAGMNMEEYLEHSKKTKETMMEEFRPEAEKRARFQLVINAISKDAKITPNDQDVETEAQKLVDMYPGADMNRTRAYADLILTNNMVLEMLESE